MQKIKKIQKIADVIKVRILIWGRLSWIIWMDLKYNHKLLTKGRQRQISQTKEEKEI